MTPKTLGKPHLTGGLGIRASGTGSCLVSYGVRQQAPASRLIGLPHAGSVMTAKGPRLAQGLLVVQRAHVRSPGGERGSTPREELNMTENKALKKAIRERMSETGESYTEARRAVLAEHRAAPTTEVGADRIQRDDLSAQNDAQAVSPQSTPDQVVRFQPLADSINTQMRSAQPLAEAYARLAASITEPIRRAVMQNARVPVVPAVPVPGPRRLGLRADPSRDGGEREGLGPRRRFNSRNWPPRSPSRFVARWRTRGSRPSRRASCRNW